MGIPSLESLKKIVVDCPKISKAIAFYQTLFELDYKSDAGPTKWNYVWSWAFI